MGDTDRTLAYLSATADLITGRALNVVLSALPEDQVQEATRSLRGDIADLVKLEARHKASQMAMTQLRELMADEDNDVDLKAEYKR
jgi:hypothetical protein